MTEVIDQKVKQYIAKHSMLRSGDEVVIGVSGGADSMMLLHFLNRHKGFYQIHLKVAHVHHGIRANADQDAAYVETIAREWKLPFYIKKCNIPELANEWQMTEEEAGRKVRYDFFISLTNQDGKIATAHNMNDQAETMMMRFLRGTDIQGLRGIPPKRENIIRPILGLTREEVEKYCSEWNLVYQQDETNFMPIYTRNKLRLECIPYIKEHFNSNIIHVMARQSEVYGEADAFLTQYTHKIFQGISSFVEGKVSLKRDELLKQEVYIQKRLVLKAIDKLLGHTKEISSNHIKAILELITKQSGKKINLPFSICVINDYEEVHFSIKEEDKISNYEYTLQMGTTNIKEVAFSFQIKEVTAKTFEQRQENMYTKYIDYDKIKDSLRIRNRQPLDVITLPGGTKKLKKFFSDEKIPLEIRNTMPLVVDGNEIVWVVGSRLNSKYYVTDKTTRVLELIALKEHMLQEGSC